MAIGEASANIPASESSDTTAEIPVAASSGLGRRRPADPVPNVASKRLRAKTPPPNSSQAVTLCLRGLNIQWPFSQLILMGAKTEEVREYDLGHRKICEAKEETWIVETRGPSASSTANAISDDLELAPRPHAAQIVGTVSFDGAHLYDNTWVDAEHFSAVQERVFLFGVLFRVRF